AHLTAQRYSKATLRKRAGYLLGFGEFLVRQAGLNITTISQWAEPFLSHSPAMHLLQSGVEVNVIRSWLGHVSISTTNRYIEIDLAMKRKALETCEVGTKEITHPSWERSPDILAWLESL